jgi:hypothetical protein
MPFHASSEFNKQKSLRVAPGAAQFTNSISFSNRSTSASQRIAANNVPRIGPHVCLNLYQWADTAPKQPFEVGTNRGAAPCIYLPTDQRVHVGVMWDVAWGMSLPNYIDIVIDKCKSWLILMWAEGCIHEQGCAMLLSVPLPLLFL